MTANQQSNQRRGVNIMSPGKTLPYGDSGARSSTDLPDIPLHRGIVRGFALAHSQPQNPLSGSRFKAYTYGQSRPSLRPIII